MSQIFKRKRILIYPKFQLLLIAIQGTLSLAAFGLYCLTIKSVFSHFESLGRQINLPTDHSFFKLLDIQFHTVFSRMAFFFVISTALSILVSFLISHRLAGPIVRLKSYFREIAEKGRWIYPLKFRKGDYFEDLPDVVNQAFNSLSSKD